jgi:hypothetical protein
MPNAACNKTYDRLLANCELNDRRFTGKIPASIGALQNLRSFIIYEQCLHSTNASGDCFYMNRVKEDGWLNENGSINQERVDQNEDGGHNRFWRCPDPANGQTGFSGTLPTAMAKLTKLKNFWWVLVAGGTRLPTSTMNNH